MQNEVTEIKMEVWMLVDDYTPDAGSTIYGVYISEEVAELALEELESEDNEYGCNMNEEDTIEIRRERVWTA